MNSFRLFTNHGGGGWWSDEVSHAHGRTPVAGVIGSRSDGMWDHLTGVRDRVSDPRNEPHSRPWPKGPTTSTTGTFSWSPLATGPCENPWTGASYRRYMGNKRAFTGLDWSIKPKRSLAGRSTFGSGQLAWIILVHMVRCASSALSITITLVYILTPQQATRWRPASLAKLSAEPC